MTADVSSQMFDVDPLFYGPCIHEAGHTVASRAFGFPVAWVSIDSAFTSKDPLAIENDCAGMHVAMSLSSARMEPILTRGFTTSPEERETIRGYCIKAAAGPLSEERVNPFFAPEVGENDYGQISYVLSRVERDKSKRKRRFVVLLNETRNFIDENWEMIGFLASELHSRKTLLSDEIDDILRQTPQAISVPMLSGREGEKLLR